MIPPSQSVARRVKAAIASLSIAVLILLLFTFPTGPTDQYVRHAISGLGICACGPFSPLVLFHLPFEASLIASALWPIYLSLIAFTRIGLAHWGRHLTAVFSWSAVGLMFVVIAGAGV